MWLPERVHSGKQVVLFSWGGLPVGPVTFPFMQHSVAVDCVAATHVAGLRMGRWFAFLLAGVCGVGAALGQHPQLRVTQTSDQRIRVAWPSSFTGYVFESAATLNSPIMWSTVEAAPQVEAGESVVLLATSSVSRYYRLRKQQLAGLTRIE